MAYFNRFWSYYKRPFRRFSGYFRSGYRRFSGYSRRRFSTFKSKYNSYSKGRKAGLIFGLVFALIGIPLIFMLYKNRDQIKALLNKGGNN